MNAAEAETAARLMERILADPGFRARFRIDPVGACKEAGLDELAEEMAVAGGGAMKSLDVRESKSSLAGVFMGVAFEAVGLVEFSEHVLPGLEEVPGKVADVLSRVNLPAIPLPNFHGDPGGAALGAAAVPAPSGDGVAGAADAASAGGGGGGVAATASALPDAPPAGGAVKDAAAEAASNGKGGAAAAAQPDAAQSAAKQVADASKPDPNAPADQAAADLNSQSQLPSSNELPDAPATSPTASSLPDAPDLPTAPAGPSFADLPQAHSAELSDAVLSDANVLLDGNGRQAFSGGVVDPRMAAILLKLSESHKLTISSTSDGISISAIDGVPVNADNVLARDVVGELAELDPSIRPTEVGTPWPISSPGYFSDAAHSDHIQIAFTDPITNDWKPPDGVLPNGAAPPAAGAPAAAASALAAPAPAAPAAPNPLGAAALKIAESQKGVHEIGSTNTGPQVDKFLASAGVSPGNPWCASFVTWSLEQAGHKMPGSGWAAVSTWVQNAEQGSNGLKIVSAQDARPGDIVAYDWGGGTDFSSDGHIGFLASNVDGGGQFKALEGNNDDAVNLVDRHLGGGPNIVFIRADGDPSAAAAAAAQAPAPGAALSGAVAPSTAPPAAAAVTPAAAPPVAPAGPPPRQSASFMAVTAKAAAEHKANASQSFLPAVKPDAATPAAPGDPNALAGPAAPAAASTPAASSPSADAVAQAAAGFTGSADLTYPGDNASQAQIAAWMGNLAQQRGLPRELPVMASLVESGMKNLNSGDRDSVGFYQMRTGIWNQGAYAGFPDKPELQVKWFLDQAEAVKKQRLAAGKSITDPHQYGDWIADVERPAEQYRGRYQLRLDQAQGLLKSAPSAPAAPAAAAPVAQAAAASVDPGAAAAQIADAGLPASVAKPVADAIASGHAPGPQALKAIEEASKYMGTPYHWGGSTPQTGFDCSGLMQWAYAQAGIQTPRVTYDQIDAANAIKVPDINDLRPGDMVFFSNAGDVHHVGMYLGDHMFLHAPHTGDVVKVSSLDEPYYQQQFAGGRRFDNGTPVAGLPASAPPAQQLAGPVAAAPAPVAPPAAPAPDPAAVAKAQAHLAVDAADARRHQSQMFMAITAQEASKAKEVQRVSAMFLPAVKPDQVKAVAATPDLSGPAPPPAAPAPDATAAAAPQSAPAAAPPAEPSPDLSAGASVDMTDAASTYPGDNATQAQLAKWLAAQAQKAGLPPELPVMASLVESGVKNINYGDRDSVGFFQMRVGIWNQGAYAGFPDKPELQAKWFIDNALEVKRQAIANGDANFGKDPSKYGDWIADVERPAEQFRYRYQLRLGEAQRLLSG